MKIVIIGQKGIPARFGGVERHVEELSTRLVKLGHEVTVYARKNYTDGNIKEYQGVKIINLPSIGTKHLDAISHTFLACLNVIFKQNADVVHFHSIGPSSLIWLIRLFKPRVKVVATFHSQCYNHQKWGVFAKTFLHIGEYACINLAHETIAVSKSLQRYAQEKYGKTVKYVPNGVPVLPSVPADEIKRFGLEENNYILSVSRLIKHKGIHYLIEAFNQMKTDKKLVIVGSASYTNGYEAELKALAKDNKNIIFTGNQSGQALAELYSNAYLFVQPSESEGLSIALLEALSYGKAALVSSIAENTEVVADNDFIFENKNVVDLKNKLEVLLNDKEKVYKSGVNGKEKVMNLYNWDNITRDVVEIYN